MTPDMDPRALLRRMFDAAIAAAQPATCLPPLLPEPPRGRTVVIGFGKGSAEMITRLRPWSSQDTSPHSKSTPAAHN